MHRRKFNENSWIIFIFFPFIFIAICIFYFQGCSGKKGADYQSQLLIDNSNILGWLQEPFYEDNTAMDIEREVKCYEIFVSDVPILDNYSVSIAAVAGTYTDNTGKIFVSDCFDLNSLRPFGINVDNGAKFIFMKTESIDNVSSEFSQPHQWGKFKAEVVK